MSSGNGDSGDKEVVEEEEAEEDEELEGKLMQNPRSMFQKK